MGYRGHGAQTQRSPSKARMFDSVLCGRAPCALWQKNLHGKARWMRSTLPAEPEGDQAGASAHTEFSKNAAHVGMNR